MLHAETKIDKYASSYVLLNHELYWSWQLLTTREHTPGLRVCLCFIWGESWRWRIRGVLGEGGLSVTRALVRLQVSQALPICLFFTKLVNYNIFPRAHPRMVEQQPTVSIDRVCLPCYFCLSRDGLPPRVQVYCKGVVSVPERPQQFDTLPRKHTI